MLLVHTYKRKNFIISINQKKKKKNIGELGYQLS